MSILRFLNNPQTAPGSPTNLVVVQASPTSLYVSWTPPSTGGAVTSYQLTGRLTSVGGAATNYAPAGPSPSALVTGLTPGTAYDFQVAATNAFGTGVSAVFSNYSTPASVPLISGWVASTAYLVGALVTYGGTLYQASAAHTSGATFDASKWTNEVTGTAPVAASGVTSAYQVIGADGTYVTIATINGLGSGGGTSTPAITLATPGTAPTASTAFSLTATLSGYASQPVLSASVDGGTAAALPSPTFTPSSGAPTSVTWQQAGLTATAHTIQVRDGNNVQSNTITVTPTAAATVPGQVTGLGTNTITATTIGLAWTAPSTGNAATSYTVTYTPSGGSPSTVATGSTAASYTLTGLTASTAYTITVTATNGVGSGTASSSVTGTTSAAAAALTMSSPTYGTGQFSQALTGGGGAQALTMAATNTWTLECWFKSVSSTSVANRRVIGLHVSGTQGSNETMFLVNGRSLIGYASGYPYTFPAAAMDGNWHHVVIQSSSSGGARTFYLDGVGSSPGGPQSLPANPTIILQADGMSASVFYNDNGSNGLSAPGDGYGQIDEVRLSSVDRYSSTTFTVPSAAFTHDANTVAIYHLDGNGTQN